ncbi:hypothetical protein INR49_015910 [Caranx melampygus]|nr:hypothetical protein INR49_015910 [Caranx melampygus]
MRAHWTLNTLGPVCQVDMFQTVPDTSSYVKAQRLCHCGETRRFRAQNNSRFVVSELNGSGKQRARGGWGGKDNKSKVNVY